ncbi:hypothetical protein MJT46_004643 [Ovis ammon polii x Ovis aries]|nr:hypothetical protein MJT46_004643 [Ovis ammon polii x Ovis aries]
MTYRCLLQMVLLLCLSTTALCRSYSLLRFQQGRSLEVCQNLLWQLPSTPQHCLEFRMDFQVPEEMKQAQQFRKEDAVLVMYEMLQHIFNILTRDFSSTGWSDTIIEHLREELYGQMNRLEPIQKEIMQKQSSTMGDTTDLHLKKYYFNLGQYLKAKEHNSSPTRINCKLSYHCDSKAKTTDPQRSRSRVGLEKQTVCGPQNLPRPPLQAVLQAPSIPMALPVSVLLALVMLCSSPMCSLGCELPASHGNLESFIHWSQMERVPTVSCLRDRTDFRFPQTLVPGTRLEKTEATAVVHELLQQTFQLFSTTGSSAGRDESLLDRFLVGLDQQLEDLDACLREGRTLEQSPLGSENSRLAVKGYFQRTSVYLKEKEYSRCAWEVVSVEIRRRLVFANKLIRKLRK